MTRITAFVFVCLIITPALANDQTPCWKIRAKVAQYGEAFVTAWARAEGYSEKEIARGKRCLK